MWSKDTKDGLLRHNARLIMVDSLGSSEAIGMATNTTSADSQSETAKFTLGAEHPRRHRRQPRRRAGIR